MHSKKRNTRISFCSEGGSHIFSYSMGSLGNKKSKRGNVFFVKDLCFRFLQELEKYKVNSFVDDISNRDGTYEENWEVEFPNN